MDWSSKVSHQRLASHQINQTVREQIIFLRRAIKEHYPKIQGVQITLEKIQDPSFSLIMDLEVYDDGE